MTKTFFYKPLLLLLAFTCSAVSFSQTLPAGKAGKFGIDGDIFSDTAIGGGFAAGGSHDWFKKAGGTGVGVFDTTGAAAIKKRIDLGDNVGFSRKMQYPLYSIQDGNLIMDAAYSRDYYGMGTGSPMGDKTAFVANGTISNKLYQDPSTWTTVPSGTSVPSKTDIIDTYVDIRRNGTTLSGANLSHIILSVGATTLATGGSHFMSFIFYKTQMNYDTIKGTFYNTGPAASGGNNAWTFNADGSIKEFGDLAISFDFGTSVSNIQLLVWCSYNDYLLSNPTRFNFISGNWYANSSNGGYGWAAITPKSGSALQAWGAVNTTTTSGPQWGTSSKDLGITSNNYASAGYAPYQFAEAAIDLTSAGVDPALMYQMTACAPPYSRYFVCTRSASGLGAAMQDFAGPYEFLQLPVVPANILIPGVFTCKVSQLNLSPVAYTNGAYYSWYTPDGNIVSSNADSSTVTINTPGKYKLSTSVVKGCSITSDSLVISADYAKPKATASVAGMLFAGQTVQLYGGDTTLSNYPTSFGESQGLKWEWTGPFGFYATWQNPITSVPGFHRLVITEKRNGCKDTATVYVIPYPVLPVRFTNFAVSNRQDKNLLRWGIADAAGAKEFRIEKSSDGITFSELLQVPADEKKTAYEIADLSTAAVVFYRIAAVDYASKHTYSAVAKVNASAVQKAPLVYRSGTNLVLQYDALEDEPVCINILTTSGQHVWKGQFAAKAGANQWQSSLPGNLAESVYVVHVQGTKSSVSAKLKW